MSTETAGAVHTTAEVVSNRAVGAFRQLSLRVPGLEQAVRPGSVLLTSVPEPRLARRALWIHQVRPSGLGQVLDVVVSVQGPGTQWLAGLPEGALLEVTGPVGRPFALPREPVPCLLVGESWQAAPLFALAERLAARECAVTLLLGGASESDLLSTAPLRRVLREVQVATADGSLGQHGHVLDLLPGTAERSGAAVFYGSGTLPTMAGLAAEAEARGAWSQVTVHAPAPCGTGLCHGCSVPALSEGGSLRAVRGCVEGPVFRGDRLSWPNLVTS